MGRFANGHVLQELASLAGACPANILVVGDLSAAQRDYVTSIVALRRQTEAYLADTVEQLPVQTGVLVVLNDPSRLGGQDQERLLRWVDDTQPQILSFTCAPLYPLVRSGRFLDALFYRLNVLRFEVSPTDIPQGNG